MSQEADAIPFPAEEHASAVHRQDAVSASECNAEGTQQAVPACNKTCHFFSLSLFFFLLFSLSHRQQRSNSIALGSGLPISQGELPSRKKKIKNTHCWEAEAYSERQYKWNGRS